MKKAIGYVGDFGLSCQSSTPIDYDLQCRRIKDFSRNEGLFLVETVMESDCKSDLPDRPGLQYVLSRCPEVDFVIVERPWCLARRSSVLGNFLQKLDEHNVMLVCATHLWDCSSQYVRRYYHARGEKFAEFGEEPLLFKKIC
ncbi:MAG: recombinase family protein [Pseudomonadota bacterium]